MLPKSCYLVLLLLLSIPPSPDLKGGTSCDAKAIDYATKVKIFFIEDHRLITTVIDTNLLEEALKQLKNTIQTSKPMIIATLARAGLTNHRKFINRPAKEVLDDTVKRIDHMLEELDKLKELGRNPRSLKFVGDILHYVAGTPTKKMHEDVTNEVHQLLLNQDLQGMTLKKLGKNTRYLTHEMLNTNHHLQSMMRILKGFQHKISAARQTDVAVLNYIQIESVANKVLNIGESMLRKTDSIYTEGKEHYLSIYAIDTKVLRETIKNISYEVPQDPLFKHNIERYYENRLTRVSWKEGRLFVTVKIPLLEASKSHELIPHIGTEKERNEEFAAIAKRENGDFCYLTASDLQKCNLIDDNELLCDKRVAYLKNKKVVVYAINKNIFMIKLSTEREEEIELYCKEGKKETLMIKGTSSIEIPDGCSVRHEDFYIEKQKKASSTKTVKNNFNITVHNEEFETDREENEEMADLNKKLAMQEERLKYIEENAKEIELINKNIQLATRNIEALNWAIGGGGGTVSTLFLLIATAALLLGFSNRRKIRKIKGK